MVKVEQILDGIPVVLIKPDSGVGGNVVLWMSHLGGSAAQTVPMLERFATAGHPAVSFDAVGHGSRGSGDSWAFAAEILAAFRRRMWPILGQTTLEAMRVLTWAQEQTGSLGEALAGGVSMGGDVAVALAGIDARVRAVATVGSTPNWSRPDMREPGDDARILDQGEADPYSQWFADNLDPSRHLERYRRGCAITFELGEADRHIPSENAQAFVRGLQQIDPAAAARIRIQTYPGLDHLGVTSNDTPLTAAADWLITGQPGFAQSPHDQQLPGWRRTLPG
jgi:dienelactone hydrolase